MKPNERQQYQVELLTLALLDLKAGRRDTAERAIQIDALTTEQLTQGCASRLNAAYNFFNGYGPKRRIKKTLLRQAYAVLREHGIPNLIAPPGKP